MAQNFAGIVQNKHVFGDDTEVFRPDRWLNASPEKRQEMQQVTEMVFGYGRWACLGKPIAMMELNKAIVEVSSHLFIPIFGIPQTRQQLLRRFDLQLVDPKSPWHETDVYITFVHGLYVKVTERFPE